jgi:imidazolonepropionase-like amidohydrolase
MGYLITAAAVYGSFPGPASSPGAVLVSGDRIVAAGNRAEVEAQVTGAAAPSTEAAPPGTGRALVRLDLGSAVVLPGFIDSHVHLSFDASDDPVGHLRQALDDSLASDGSLVSGTSLTSGTSLASVIADSAAGLLRAGVTTARDLGAPGLLDVRAREQIRAGRLPGPYLLLACQPLTTPGGHCWYMGGECASTADLLAAVRARRQAGADWIKIMLSGGFLTDGTLPAEPQFDLATLRAVTDAAHDAGLRVAVHAHSTKALWSAARVGVDTIEHGTFLSAQGVDFDLELADLLARERIPICPTVNSATGSYPAESGTDALARLHRLHRAGVPVIMGTDAGVRQVPGSHYAAGLLALHRAGFTAAEVLAAATSAAADALGLAAVTGRLLPGLRADLVALPADPLVDLAATGRPIAIMKGGQPVLWPAGLTDTTGVIGVTDLRDSTGTINTIGTIGTSSTSATSTAVTRTARA